MLGERFSVGHPEFSAMQRSMVAHIEKLKEFMLRGKLPSLVAGIVVALIAVDLIEALVRGVIGPLIAALFSDSRPLEFVSFTINESEVFYGAVIQAAIAFVVAIVAIYFLLIRPYDASRQHPRQDSNLGPSD
jgi:large conductance mechanosensitive channel